MTLNDISEFIIDCEHKTAPTQDTGIPSIRTPNIGRGRLILEGVNRVSEETYQEWTKRGEPEENDLVIAREAPVGNIAIIPSNTKVCLGQRTVLVRPNSTKVNPLYLVYLLLGNELQGQILTKTSGATVAHLNMKDIRELEISKLPARPIQNKIASILSAYDELIENNNQRIQLLETMAEEIYQEWFVRLRFPGYQDTPVVDGVPEGWEKKGIFDLSHVTYGYPFKSSDFNEEQSGMPLIRIRDIRNNFSKTYSPEKADSRYIVENGDMLVGMDGDFHVGKWAGGEAYLNQRVVRFRPKDSISKYFIYFAFKKQIEFLNQVISGTTVAHLSDKDIKQVKILSPPSHLMSEFAMKCDNLLELEINLESKNQVLQQTRDLLLPRLISGKLSVEHLLEAENNPPVLAETHT